MLEIFNPKQDSQFIPLALAKLMNVNDMRMSTAGKGNWKTISLSNGYNEPSSTRRNAYEVIC